MDSPGWVGFKRISVSQVIGDGAITGGMAYEAMNHAGFLDTNMIVILNDNQQVWSYCVLFAFAVIYHAGCPAYPYRYTLLVWLFFFLLPMWVQVSLPTQYNGKNQEPVGALSSALARLQVHSRLLPLTCTHKPRIIC